MRVGLAACVVLALAVSSACSSGGSLGGSHTITGRVQYQGVDSCIIDSANDVTLEDEHGTVLAAANMGSIQGTGGDCYEDFTISNVPSASVYQFAMSGYVFKTLSRSDLAAMNWNLGVINPP